MRFMTGPNFDAKLYVHAISIDFQTADGTFAYADEFGPRPYSNNQGSACFTTAWNEINDDNKSDGGKVKIDNERLRKLEDANHGAWRAFDLTRRQPVPV